MCQIRNFGMDSIGVLTASISTNSLGFYGSWLVMIILGKSCNSVSTGVRVVNWTLITLECIGIFNLSSTSMISGLPLSNGLSPIIVMKELLVLYKYILPLYNHLLSPLPLPPCWSLRPLPNIPPIPRPYIPISLMDKKMRVTLAIWGGGGFLFTSFLKMEKACSSLKFILCLVILIPIIYFTCTINLFCILFNNIRRFILSEWTTWPYQRLNIVKAEVICFSNSSHHMWVFFSPE